jgi:hypothetical protein
VIVAASDFKKTSIQFGLAEDGVTGAEEDDAAESLEAARGVTEGKAED